jgi:hypothetical protein
MAHHSRTVGAMRSAHIAWAQCGSLSIGGNGIVNRVAHMLGDDILRADLNTWFVVNLIILLGVGALTLHSYDVQLIWIAFGWFVLSALLLGYGGEHL